MKKQNISPSILVAGDGGGGGGGGGGGDDWPALSVVKQNISILV